jgi:hypothetical protein
MMTRPVAEFLTRFDGDRDAAEVVEAPRIELVPLWPEEPVRGEDPRHAEEVEAARESGKAEGFAAAQEELSLELERQRQSFDMQLRAARQHWCREQGDLLRERFEAALAEIEQRIAEGLGRVLMPFLTEVLRRRMMEELIETIDLLVASNETVTIKIEGPYDLLASLQAKLATRRAMIEYAVADGIDLVVTADQTKIETQLAAWLASISPAIE